MCTVKAHKRKGRAVKAHTRKTKKAPAGWRKRKSEGMDPSALSKAKQNALKKKGVNLDSVKYSGL